ncbi:hypothetical protein TYRP_016514 [Tyrophagus putrescentiae]|nr:hypothetical protein TYRP_016514 [Tyrophagus putrescentiae]
MHSSAVHGTRRQGLTPLDHCKLPLPRGSRAKRAGPEAAEVYSGQAMLANVFAQHSDCTCIHQQCTAQSGEVWHLLATVNFRCLGPRERSERGPRRRKFTVYKRCRVSRRHVRQVLVTRSSSARAETPPSTLGHHFIQSSSFHGPLGAHSKPLGAISRPFGAIFRPYGAIFGPHGAISRPSPGQPVPICIMATWGHRQATHGLSPGYSKLSPSHSRAISL